LIFNGSFFSRIWVIWDPYQAARFVTGDNKSCDKGCVSSMLRDLQLLPLQERLQQNRQIFLYKITERHVPANRSREIPFT
ncbi:hypothetical protein, partial [Salmonella sp. s55004]|uniref:hypothetical protein n=1 Tax=Salmonella sp. s55004 TaxID=3159675 RepID=UPI00398158FF